MPDEQIGDPRRGVSDMLSGVPLACAWSFAGITTSAPSRKLDRARNEATWSPAARTAPGSGSHSPTTSPARTGREMARVVPPLGRPRSTKPWSANRVPCGPRYTRHGHDPVRSKPTGMRTRTDEPGPAIARSVGHPRRRTREFRVEGSTTGRRSPRSRPCVDAAVRLSVPRPQTLRSADFRAARCHMFGRQPRSPRSSPAPTLWSVSELASLRSRLLAGGDVRDADARTKNNTLVRERRAGLVFRSMIRTGSARSRPFASSRSARARSTSSATTAWAQAASRAGLWPQTPRAASCAFAAREGRAGSSETSCALSTVPRCGTDPTGSERRLTERSRRTSFAGVTDWSASTVPNRRWSEARCYPSRRNRGR
jgi:hypothetical protein